ncbi:MAG: hypothetical protein GY786_15220 [Proteobacteria bacterium]|nr:hypothetical protein [Pseudomonadota bacterium]
MVLKIVVAFILALILLYIIISMLKERKNSEISRFQSTGTTYRDCPICGYPLKRGETVHSHLYPGKPDGMMYIYGCPYCFRDHPKLIEIKDVRRICPYCRTDIPEDGWVIARVFEKPEKTHVHVLGCTVCRKGK